MTTMDGVEIVRVAGYFWGRYFVATFVVDARRRVTAMVSKRGFDRFVDAERGVSGRRGLTPPLFP